MTSRRFDVAKLDKIEITEQGYLRAAAKFTRTGIFKYMMYDGSIKYELRPEEEVFQVDTLKSLASQPITNNHPLSMLDSGNVKLHQVGFTGEEINKDGEYTAGKVNIMDAEAVRQVKDEKKVELSCGYQCDVEDQEGDYKGQHYDAIQRNIVYNHVAIVDKGRAGAEAKIKLDRFDGIMVEDNVKAVKTDIKQMKKQKGGDTMPEVKIKVDGIEYEVSEGLADKIVKKDKALDEFKADMEKKTSEFDELKGKHDGLETELKKKDEEIEKIKEEKPDMETLKKDAKARIDLENTVKELLGKEEAEKVDFATATDSELKKTVLVKEDAELKLDESSDDYINGMFDVVLKKVSSKKDSSNKSDAFKKELGKKVNDGEAFDLDKKLEEHKRIDSERWKKSLMKNEK